ncbi:MAG: hypothetical protein Q8Q14_04670 [Gemmatimonadales bacterium]|nr:hypothetical protein [Gemmatimonadales bacterium]
MTIACACWARGKEREAAALLAAVQVRMVETARRVPAKMRVRRARRAA